MLRAAFLVIVIPLSAWSPATNDATARLDDPVIGDWRTESGQVIEIEQCGDTICGRVVSLDRPYDDDGMPARDAMNPDEAMRTEPICKCRVLLGGFEREGVGRWRSGEIYDPRSGEVYAAKLTVADGGQSLKVRGYVGVSVLGSTRTWTRAPNYDACPMEPQAAAVGENVSAPG